MKGNTMKKVSKNSEEINIVHEYLMVLGQTVLAQEARIKKLGRVLILGLLGFSALGTYLVIKNNQK
jgi:hypothetical protein